MVNRKSILESIGVVLGALLISVSSLAAGPTLNSSCSLEDGDGNKIEGINTKVRYPIASVSKVFTAFWAIHRFGPNFRYATRIFITPLDSENKIADVHFAGTYDPYFDKERLQFMVSELNKLNVRKIRNLTFDERFVFSQVRVGKRALDISDNEFAWSTIFPSHPAPNSVMNGLRMALNTISQKYTVLRAGQAANSVEMVATPSIKVDDIRFVSESNFKSTANTRMFYSRSAPLHVLAKEMNSQSNNWVAEMMFKSLGGASEFAKFMKEELKLGPEDVLFVNGSGNRIEPEIPVKYNEATCEAVVKMISAFDEKMLQLKMSLDDVMAVAGDYSEGTMNTVNRYSTEMSSHALIAKTGSINPTIALAGLASTNDGNVYFAYNFHTNTRGQWGSARAKISIAINQLFRKHDKKKVIESQTKKFFSFDSESSFIEAKPKLNFAGKG